jgi:hypothetical protein
VETTPARAPTWIRRHGSHPFPLPFFLVARDAAGIEHAGQIAQGNAVIGDGAAKPLAGQGAGQHAAEEIASLLGSLYLVNQLAQPLAIRPRAPAPSPKPKSKNRFFRHELGRLCAVLNPLKK